MNFQPFTVKVSNLVLSYKQVTDEEDKLEVFQNKSVLHIEAGSFEFTEGPQSDEAKSRYAQIKAKFETGYFEDFIDHCIKNPEFDFELEENIQQYLNDLIESITSEVGRAVVALCIMQLVIKSICPSQSIRLHKGGPSSSTFGWKEGISMRVLDKNFVTPVLRSFDLIKLNNDGFMMTRSLAENYPYSKLYKASIRGRKDVWAEIVDIIEEEPSVAKNALEYCIKKLINQTAKFNEQVDKCLELLSVKKAKFEDIKFTTTFILDLLNSTDYSARLFEVAMHALYQILEEHNCLEGNLKPLSQMRSANKKHKNVGDIETVIPTNERVVVEAWDAKYGKPYLRDELDELQDKLEGQSSIVIAGFVVDTQPTLSNDVVSKCNDIQQLQNINIQILSFEEWVLNHFSRVSDEINEQDFSYKWITAISESLGQKRRAIAPIDEPCSEWINDLLKKIEKL